MSDVITDKKLKGKDLITIGIFSAIYFVINFAFMLLGGIHPVLWMLMPGFIAVFAGIPFMLMVAKVQKLGAVFLMGLITALIYFVTGQFTLVILISMASTCILAEVVRVVTKYNSFKGNSIAYVIFSLGMVDLDRIIQHIYKDNVPGKLSDSRYLFLNLVFHIHFVKCFEIMIKHRI